MNKPLLPFHKTGWLYLIVLLWVGSYLYHAEGGFDDIEQFNIDLLFKSKKDTKDFPKTIANLRSSFKGNDFENIEQILAMYPDTSIALLGDLSESFNVKLQAYLENNPRKLKLIIGSENFSSALSIAGKEEVNLNSVLDSIRHPEKVNVNRLTSPYFVFTPLNKSTQQNHTFFWRQNNQTFLTLAGEMLRQLVLNNNIKVHKGWHIELTATHNDSSQSWPLGFKGETFIQSRTELSTPIRYFLDYQLANEESIALREKSFSAIIISEGNGYDGDQSARLLETLINHQYLYQTLPVIVLSWLLLVVSLGLLWFSVRLSVKKQFIVISTFIIFSICAQYLVFSDEQWLSILPAIIILIATWFLLLAYQSENKLFIEAYKHQSKNSTTKGMVKSSSTKAPRKLVSKSPAKVTTNAPRSLQMKTSKTKADLSDSLDATMVVTPEQAQAMALAKERGFQAKSFGRYEVEGVLGKGAMGIVYQGVDPKINRHVAIKTLQLNHQESAEEYLEAKNRFFREAQTAGGLSHSNIVTIYDVGEEGDLGYIAMDLLTGAPLSEFIKPENLLPPALVYQLMIQITDALEYAHTQNVVHRDIKPANVIFDDDLLKVTVTDFGIAYVSDNSKTKTGVIMGSPYYMSPEQILGLKVDGRSDIFSLGVTFYQLLSGVLPFKGESIATVAYQITKSKATSVNQVNAKLPASALRITNKAMHKDSNKRYQTMGEFKLALENALKRDFKKA
ncbi:MAG: serine/threonine-protein kinase [Colwellia sp.]